MYDMLTMSHNLDSFREDELPLGVFEGLQNVVHGASKSEPCGEDNAQSVVLDVGKEEADDVDLGDARLIKGVVRGSVWLHGSLEGGVGQDDARQGGLGRRFIFVADPNVKVGHIELLLVSGPGHASRNEWHRQAYSEAEIVLQLDGDVGLLRPWGRALVFT
jgi:hypothetical protein